MTKKRKRRDGGLLDTAAKKRHKISNNGTSATSHPVLSTFYPQVFTLRRYLLTQCSELSRNSKQSVEDYGLRNGKDSDPALADLLDTTLVGVPASKAAPTTQQPKNNSCPAISASTPTTSQGVFSQPEIVDRAIWQLFNVVHPHSKKPPHVLCHGTQRAAPTLDNGEDISAAASVAGLARMQPNEHVERIKGAPWTGLLGLLGRAGPAVMLRLIVRCGVFVPLDRRLGSLYQLSGRPLSEIKSGSNGAARRDEVQNARKPSEIRFARSQLMYAKAALNAKGQVAFGLRHIHVLNRLVDLEDEKQTLQIARYIFPREFGLHNVFTSTSDGRGVGAQDYQIREHEIDRLLSTCRDAAKTRAPKRLRGEALSLIGRLRKLHRRCPYVLLLRYYCPLPDSSIDTSTQPSSPQLEFSELATPHHRVSAFCRGIISRILPRELLGTGIDGRRNFQLLLGNVDAFIRARRFESLTLDAVLHGINVKCISWLRPAGLDQECKMSQSDFTKRKELLAELLYYILDSFLIPLVRTNFYVTESNKGKNRLFYFRHDVWKRLSEPAMSRLKVTMFEEMPTEEAEKMLATRLIGANKVRLLPKATSMRTIMNLKRRTQLARYGLRVLGRSTNSVVAPAFHVLNGVKTSRPELLGASIFSVGQMYDKLKAFKRQLASAGIEAGQPLYFVSLDVKSCFDSLPQDETLNYIEQLLQDSEFTICNYEEYGPPLLRVKGDGNAGYAKRTFRNLARDTSRTADFPSLAEQGSKKHARNAVLVDSVVHQRWSNTRINDLLREHIQANIVAIGKRFYRQKKGIAQGSVLSTLVCSLLYAKFERERLTFLHRAPHLLVRLIDDFLLITTDITVAEEFAREMFAGSELYGIEIARHKTLANFALVIDGETVSRATDRRFFPYCGISLDTCSLEVRKGSIATAPEGIAADSLTVEYTRSPVVTMRRKILSMLKIQMHVMFVDTSHNSSLAVARNLFNIFSDVAGRVVKYLGALRNPKHPVGQSIRELVRDASELAVSAMRGRGRGRGRGNEAGGYSCAIKAQQVQWIATAAFVRAFRPKQTKYSSAMALLVQDLCDLERPYKKGARQARKLGLLRKAISCS